MVDERWNGPFDGPVFVGPPQFMAAIKSVSSLGSNKLAYVFSLWHKRTHAIRNKSMRGGGVVSLSEE